MFAFSSGDLDRILAVEPDLVLGFSDMQADVARDLIKAGVAVHVFNQRSVDDILAMIETVGRLVGVEDRALALVAGSRRRWPTCARRRPGCRIGRGSYFEEWDEPPISAVRWVSELIGIAGGEDVFSECARHPGAAQRHPRRSAGGSAPGRPTSSSAPVAASASARSGWRGAQVGEDVPAVRDGEVHEVKSALILSPGPVAIRERGCRRWRRSLRAGRRVRRLPDNF